jgi:hypothetical protein
VENADTVGLANMDIIVVDNIMSYDGDNPVQVVGGGGRTGIFRVTEPEPLGVFLLRLWRIDPAAFDVESAVLERPLPGSRESVQLGFSIREVLAGRGASDLMVQPGDYIVIPPVIAHIFVAGEVMSPGPVPFQPGLTADQYVSLAGGPNRNGSYDKIKIVSREGEERKGHRDSEIYRGETVVVGIKTSRVLYGVWVGIVSLTGLVVALVALSNSTK